METVAYIIFLSSKTTADGDCSHEIQRRLLLGRKTVTNLDRILKFRDIILLTKICLVKAMVFSSGHVCVWELDHKESWASENWCFWTVVLEKTFFFFFLRVPWMARSSNQSILKEISPEYTLEGLMLKLKRQYFGHLMWFIGKDPDAGKGWRQEEKGTREDEMVGWHHRLDGHEFEQAPGVGDGQGSLVCCSPRGQKESDTDEWLNWTELILPLGVWTQ